MTTLESMKRRLDKLGSADRLRPKIVLRETRPDGEPIIRESLTDQPETPDGSLVVSIVRFADE